MDKLKSIFYNADEHRLRALVRLMIFATLFPLFMVIRRIVMAPLMEIFDYYQLVSIPLGFAMVVLLLWLMAKLFDKRKVSDYGTWWDSEWIKDLIFGLCLGIVLISFVFVLELSLGWIEITGTFYVMEDRSFWPQMIVLIFIYIYVGYYEEATSRGYALKNFAEGMNFEKTGPRFAVVFAILVSSLLFGLGHASNPNATFVGWWNIVIIGALLAYSYVITKSLAISIGVHITWNYFQGCVYGFPVSGNPVRASFLEINQLGDPLWTGGTFGPEAGLVIYFVAVIWLILLHIWLRFRKSDNTDYHTFAEYEAIEDVNM